MKKKSGLILVNAFNKSEEMMYQPRRLAEELTALGAEVEVRRADFFPVATGGAEGFRCGLSGFDFVVFLDKDKYILGGLDAAGVRVFNPPRAIEICDDKMTTHIALAKTGIPMPRTLPGLLCYDPSEKVKNSTLDIVELALGFPAVVKESYGSLGKEVFLAHDREQLRFALERVRCRPHLIQEFHCPRLWKYFCRIQADRHLPPLLHHLLHGPAQCTEGIDKIPGSLHIAHPFDILMEGLGLCQPVFFHINPIHFRPDPHGIHQGTVHIKNDSFLSF